MPQAKKETITVRMDAGKKRVLDEIADATDRDRSYIVNEAISLYLDVYRWQVAHIQESLEQAQAGQLVSHEAVKAKWKKKRAIAMDAAS
jgi:predicted transcriptional regulator